MYFLYKKSQKVKDLLIKRMNLETKKILMVERLVSFCEVQFFLKHIFPLHFSKLSNSFKVIFFILLFFLAFAEKSN